MHPIAIDLLLAGIPLGALTAITWRLVWPTWKLIAKVILHSLVYAACAMLVGHWSVLIAWGHQGLGFGGHIWFCRKHGFTWYAVEDPARYVELSKAMVGALPRK